MRFLIVASVLACIAAEPVPVGVAPEALAPAVPTISAGDINGAALEAQAEASDHVRATYDKVNELNGQAINIAQEQAWKAVDNVKTVEARLDGAAAASAPALAKHLVRTGQVAPLASYANPAFAASYTAPAVVAPTAAAPAIASYPAPAVQSYVNYDPAISPYAAPGIHYASSAVDPYYQYAPVEYPGFY